MELDIFERLFEGVSNRTYSLDMTGEEKKGGENGFQNSGFSNWTERCRLLKRKLDIEMSFIEKPNSRGTPSPWSWPQ